MSKSTPLAVVPGETLNVRLPVLLSRRFMPLLTTAVAVLALVVTVGVLVRPLYQSNATPLIVPPVIVTVSAAVPPAPPGPVKLSTPPLTAIVLTQLGPVGPRAQLLLALTVPPLLIVRLPMTIPGT